VLWLGREAASRRWHVRALSGALCAAPGLPQNPHGMDVKATVGIVESLLDLLHDPQEAITHVAVASDNPIHPFRNNLFPPYKSDGGVPPELRAQFDAAEHAVSSIGVTVWSMRESTRSKLLLAASDTLALGDGGFDGWRCGRTTDCVQQGRFAVRFADVKATA
jgi:hypothetical protein